MKLLGIPLLFLVAVTLLSVVIDMIVGNLSFRFALKNTINPFLVMDPFERVIFYYFLVSFFLVPFISAHKIKKEASKNKNKQQ